MSFLLPKDIDEGRYIKQIAKMMVSHGWMDNPTGRPVLRYPSAHQRGARRDHRRRLLLSARAARSGYQVNAAIPTTTAMHSAGIDITAQLRQR